MMRATAVVIGVSILAGAADAESHKMRLGQVLVMVPLDAAPPPVAEGVVFQADRGGRKGQYLVVTTPAAKAESAPGGGRASEYRLLSPETAGTLPDVDVLGIHYIKVRPERADAFEQFVGLYAASGGGQPPAGSAAPLLQGGGRPRRGQLHRAVCADARVTGQVPGLADPIPMLCVRRSSRCSRSPRS